MDGLMCVALCWMLQAWLPANWALLGGDCGMRLGLFSDWINTYHTVGSLAAVGGALVLGALPRLMKTARFRYGMLMALGIVILASRVPTKGFSVPAGCVRAGSLALKGKNWPPRCVSCGALHRWRSLLAAAGWGITIPGLRKATTLPYTIDRATYAVAPYYVWQHPRPEPPTGMGDEELLCEG